MDRLFGSMLAVAAAACLLTMAAPARAAEPLAGGEVPVAFNLCTAEGSNAQDKCAAFGYPPSYQVPAGRRLIVEQVSGDCGGDATEPGLPLRVGIVAQTHGVVVEHGIIGVPWPALPGGRIPLTLTRVYADGGSIVTLGITEVPGFSDRLCRIAFSGQLVKP